MYSLDTILNCEAAKILQQFSFFAAAFATVVHYEDNK